MTALVSSDAFMIVVDIGKRSRGAAIGLLFYDHSELTFLR